MLNTYIKNRGLTQTLVHNNGNNRFNQIDWDADYDGNIANISVTSNTDGNKKHFDVSLDNQDLASILNVPSINMPLDKRLHNDFITPTFRHDPSVYHIELHTPEFQPKKPSYMVEEPITSSDSKSDLQELIRSSKPTSYLSSPLPNEELIVPITIDEKTLDKYSLTPRKRHKHKKTHKTYKVYKKPKSAPNSKSKSKTSRNKSKSFSLF